MKVEIKEYGKVKERDFPRLMVDDLGQILLAISVGKGDLLTAVVIENGNATTSLGEYCESYDFRAFSDFEGSITLSND